MSLMSALILYLIVVVFLLATFIIVIKRSETKRKLLGYIVGFIISVFWPMCLVAIAVFIWFRPNNKKDEKKSVEEL